MPHAKMRPFEAASAKCLILCYRSPFADNKWPYHNPIEEYFVEGEDFIYFTDNEDLNDKIFEISNNFYDSNYQSMIDSAYRKITNDHDIVKWYNDNIIPIAEESTHAK